MPYRSYGPPNGEPYDLYGPIIAFTVTNVPYNANGTERILRYQIDVARISSYCSSDDASQYIHVELYVVCMCGTWLGTNGRSLLQKQAVSDGVLLIS